MSGVNAIVIYESLTGNTKKAAQLMGKELTNAGVGTTVCNITSVDYQALADADLVIVGTWTDGIVFFGQRPGRAGRIRAMPTLVGKRAFVFCTYAVDQGNILKKLTALVQARGAEVLGGMAIRRTSIDQGVSDFVGRLLAAVEAA
jgi:flavorubredoxin